MESPFAWYYALVRQIMYDAWEQPGSLSAAAGFSADVEIVVQRDGTITARRMQRPSGNALLDASVMKAVNAVSKLRPLPSSFIGGAHTIVITFELQKNLL